MRRVPYAHATLLAALDEYHTPPETLIIRGTGPELDTWQAAAQQGCHPRRLVLAIPAAEADLPGNLGAMVPGGAGILAYRCRGTRCEPPVRGLAELADW
jgi:hypothetical protein